MNKINIQISVQLKFRNKTVFGLFTVTVTNSLQCFLYAHAFKIMASCVTLLLYYKVVFIDFCLEYKHNNGMTFSPDLELKNSFCLAIILQEMAEKFGKMKCKTISFEIKF
jgi:hypothetical protein